IFLAVIASRSSGLSTLRQLARSPGFWALGLVGHTGYQLLFIVALANTSASNSALIIGCTPVFVALLSAAIGQERIAPVRWIGVPVSAAGIYLVVGRGATLSGASVRGDVLMLLAVLCWSMGTLISRPLLVRYPALTVSGGSMAIGTVGYLLLGWQQIGGVDWTAVKASSWLALAFSATLALCVSYMIWYTAIQRLGNTRTAVYSTLVPVAAMLTAWLAYAEPIGPAKIAGAAAIIGGVVLTRL